jgi:Flp pilus assembly pilin Flp
MRNLFLFLKRDQRGAVLVEMAMITPVLATMMVGAFDVSRAVARQTELQEVAAEFSAVAMATTLTQDSLQSLREIAAQSAGIETDKVAIQANTRCGTDPEFLEAGEDCNDDEEEADFLTISIEDQYVPIWTQFGIGGAIDLSVTRSAQIG